MSKTIRLFIFSTRWAFFLFNASYIFTITVRLCMYSGLKYIQEGQNFAAIFVRISFAHFSNGDLQGITLKYEESSVLTNIRYKRSRVANLLI